MARLEVPQTLEAARLALADGEWSPEALTEWCLARAAALQDCNAFVEITADSALASATAAGQRRRQSQRDAGRTPVPPLNGIPLAHKDLFFRPGRSPGCGSRVELPPRADQEATVLERLRLAGAVDLGPLHLSEFAYGPTGHNALLGHARNPWNSDHVSGGSSSGSALAVAGGAVYASLGSDSGGSIRTPAAWCGVSALKPSRGAISLAGVMPLAPSLDSVGIMARSARDLACVFALLAGADPRDPATHDAPVWNDEAFVRGGQARIRLGVLDAWFHEDLSAEVAAGLDRVRSHWAVALDARVVSARCRSLPQVVAHARTVLLREAWLTHAPLLERQDSRYAPGVRARLLAGAEVADAEYREALARMPGCLQDVLDSAFSDADVLLLPCNPTVAPRIDDTEQLATTVILKQVDGITRCLRPFNYLGLPALVLPAGFDGSGLPFGFQLVAKPFQESTLLALGARWQASTDWHLRHPPGLALE